MNHHNHLILSFKTMQVRDFTALIEKVAPLSFQEDYDNAGLIVGDPGMTVSGILLCLDTTENVIDEAISNGCNLIIAHHPIIFKGLRKLNGKNHVERTVIKALQHNIAIYAAHTNLDNVLQNGVNEKIAHKLGLTDLKILQPRQDTLSKLVVFTPPEYSDRILACLFENGAGKIGHYSECSFSGEGIGSFKPGTLANPFNGTVGKRKKTAETKIEVLVHNYQINNMLTAIRTIHPYEEVAYDVQPLKNGNQDVGAGVYGFLPEEMEPSQFLHYLKKSMDLTVIKHTKFAQNIKKVAVCGGVGSFLIPDAKAVGVDAYVTADVKYHAYFDVENRFMLCDIGHYESEIYTLEIFYAVITEKYPTFAVIFCKENTNPIQYFK